MHIVQLQRPQDLVLFLDHKKSICSLIGDVRIQMKDTEFSALDTFPPSIDSHKTNRKTKYIILYMIFYFFFFSFLT